MKIILKQFTFIICILAITSVNAQQNEARKALKGYEKLAYQETASELEALVSKGNTSQELIEKLANSYYFNNDMPLASKWYAVLFDKHDDIDAEYYYRYAMALKGNEKYKESDEWIMKFGELMPNDSRVKLFNSNRNYLNDIQSTNGNSTKLINVSFNSEFSDFGSFEYNNRFYFSSSRGGGKDYKWNGQPYLNVYAVEGSGIGDASDIESFEAINTKWHESSVCISPDGSYLFFTRNNYFKNDYKEDEDGVNRLQLFRVTKNDKGQWDDVIKEDINSNDYSIAHPAINKNGTKLYFASDMPGTLGQSDIFVVDINEDGTLGTPMNLGDKINTEGQESFPFVNEKGDLFFSSKSTIGLGGYDVFVVRSFENTNNLSAVQAENLGMPFNSSQDDFAYYENSKTRTGYLSSNRKGGKGDDDIYTFEVPKCKRNIIVGLQNAEDLSEIGNTGVTVENKDGEKIDLFKTDTNGKFEFRVLCSIDVIRITVEKDDFESYTSEFSISKAKDNSIDVLLKPIPKKVLPEVGTDLFKLLKLEPILFDSNKSNIRPDAQVQINKIIAYLKEYPMLKVDIRSHTDSKGRDAYNEALSQRRNEATKNYMITVGGISKDRITGKGYGESQLVNKCKNGVTCTPEEHEQNRRNEFIVISH
ncbi:OmpA family protein [Winogradskyella sp. A3E31]|uniref:OmpA family protein n=1 Tax=Winogradskyella sp. A3E31 TaxID=3349637 RepID=UPI00398B28EF